MLIVSAYRRYSWSRKDYYLVRMLPLMLGPPA
jgi:hypothetical protein